MGDDTWGTEGPKLQEAIDEARDSLKELEGIQFPLEPDEQRTFFLRKATAWGLVAVAQGLLGSTLAANDRQHSRDTEKSETRKRLDHES